MKKQQKEQICECQKKSYEAFNNLPDRAKELYWACKNAYIEKDGKTILNTLDDELIDIDKECESPIEKIMYLALMIYWQINVTNGIGIQIIAQEEIGKYRVDFHITAYALVGFEKRKELSKELIIECDGHDFHEKTKEQVSKNNNRDYELKKQGYEVLHFSGSEIFNKPMLCAGKVFNYIENCFDRMIEEGVKDHVRG